MKILKTNILRGPNYWSIYRKKIIVLKIDLQKYENYPSNLLPHFATRLVHLIPSLSQHFCSLNMEGGFIKRLHEGTWLGHVIEHVALELQNLVGLDCNYGKTRSTNTVGIYDVVFSYEIEKAGLLAGETAFQIVKTLAKGKVYSSLKKDLRALKKIVDAEKLGISTQYIVDEAHARNIPWRRLHNNSLVLLGQGKNQRLIWGSVTDQTGIIGGDIVADKYLTKHILSKNVIPVPVGYIIKKKSELKAICTQLPFPIVIKPHNGNHGNGITTRILTVKECESAFKRAKKISPTVIVEQFIEGDDYRFLVVNYKVVAVAKRIPPYIIGDGVSTVKQLIKKINEDPKRGVEHSNFLTLINIDEITLSILKKHHVTVNSILQFGKKITLKYAANLSAGGTAIDVTDHVHSDTILLAERTAALLKLNICGLDIVAKDIHKPLTESNNGAVIEVNVSPGLRMHLSPSVGKSRNVAKSIIDMLYPKNTPSRIPIIAVTGTNGKTTTVRLLAYLAKKMGYHVGFTTTDGIYINDQLIQEGDCSGPNSAQVVLQDPTVDFAVLECARGGILRSGLGFDQCDISIILNITGDHLGIDGIDTLEQLAQIKGVIAESTPNEGYALLNADDDVVYNLKEEIFCHIGLFSVDNNNQKVIEHCQQGGIGIFLKNNEIIIQDHQKIYSVGYIHQLPITFNGTARNMYSNILATVLATHLLRVPHEKIFTYLKTFISSPKNNPGRMNLFDFNHFKVLLDYAHNPSAFIEMQHYLKQHEGYKIGILSVPGDRLVEDIKTVGYYAGLIFDEIILRHEKDCRGRTNAEIIAWLREGIKRADNNKKFSIIEDEIAALEYAINNAKTGDFIVHFTTEVGESVAYLQKKQDEKNRLAK